MTAFSTQIDARELVANLADIERRQFPFAVMQTINDALFETRDEWQDTMSRVFDRPTRWTLQAVLYRKATKESLYGELFLRDEVGDGIAPDKYLRFEVRGGQRAAKRSEVLLRRAGILGGGEFIVPARRAPLDEFGNVPARTITAILSDLQAQFDETQNSTLKSRRSRLGKNRKGRLFKRADLKVRRGRRRAVYFYNPKQRGKLPRGIFRKVRTAFGVSLEGVLMIVRGTHYEPIYDVFAISNRVFNESFARRWPDNLNAAVAGVRRAGAVRRSGALTGPFAP